MHRDNATSLSLNGAALQRLTLKRVGYNVHFVWQMYARLLANVTRLEWNCVDLDIVPGKTMRGRGGTSDLGVGLRMRSGPDSRCPFLLAVFLEQSKASDDRKRRLRYAPMRTPLTV